jgi:monoamine oxidase
LIGYLRERTKLTEAAIAMLGMLQNIAGRIQFSLVEWFAHYYDDVMGHLRYVVDGADKLPDASLCDEWSSRSRRMSAGTRMFTPSRGG